MRKILIILIILALVICAIPFRGGFHRYAVSTFQALRGRKTVADRLEEFGTDVRERLAEDFAGIAAPYPPDSITLVGIKQDNLLEVWVNDPPRFLKSYPILGASGVLGPKLREGDLQVPEGMYRIESLNPNSLFHLALRVNYPNRFDLTKGRIDGRENLGGDIMIHGSDRSIGCLAMGDKAVEELFVLAAETGIENISVILTPVDFRRDELPSHMPDVPDWTPQLYDAIRQELMKLETKH